MENISTSRAKASPIYTDSNNHNRKLGDMNICFRKMEQKTHDIQFLFYFDFNPVFSFYILCLLVSWHVDMFLFKAFLGLVFKIDCPDLKHLSLLA